MADNKSGEVEGFSQQDVVMIKRLAALYLQAKSLILYSEEIDPDSRSNLQVIKELRDSHDHLMRMMSVRLTGADPAELKDGNIDDYCSINIERALGHVYRASFDALDGTIMSLKEKIVDVLNTYKIEVIKDVFPKYWEMRIKLDELTQKIATNRTKKDVGNDISAILDRYISDTEVIKDFYRALLQAGPALDACQKKYQEEEKHERSNHRTDHFAAGLSYKLVYGIVTLLVGAVVGYFVHENSQKEKETRAPLTVMPPLSK